MQSEIKPSGRSPDFPKFARPQIAAENRSRVAITIEWVSRFVWGDPEARVTDRLKPLPHPIIYFRVKKIC